MSVDVINEGSSGRLRAEFFDEDGIAAAPASLTYRIDCVTSGTAIRASSPLPAAAVVDIALTPDDTAIVNESDRTERRRVTVVAVFGVDDDLTVEYEYHVRNLTYFPGS